MCRCLSRTCAPLIPARRLPPPDACRTPPPLSPYACHAPSDGPHPIFSPLALVLRPPVPCRCPPFHMTISSRRTPPEPPLPRVGAICLLHHRSPPPGTPELVESPLSSPLLDARCLHMSPFSFCPAPFTPTPSSICRTCQSSPSCIVRHRTPPR
jgi:hypothetical protein